MLLLLLLLLLMTMTIVTLRYSGLAAAIDRTTHA